MRWRRIVLLAALLVLPSSAASASTLLTWEFTGALSTTTTRFGLDDLYPVGMPFSLNITFDTEAARIPRPAGAYGLYQAIRAATFQLGNTTTTTSGGFIAVNCYSDLGCPGPGAGPVPTPGNVEFLMFPSQQNPPLNPNARFSTVSPLEVAYRDPNVLSGGIPTTPPSGLGFLFIGVGGNPGDPLATMVGTIGSVRAIEDLAVVPEPGSLILLGTGLAGLYARRRRRRAS